METNITTTAALTTASEEILSHGFLTAFKAIHIVLTVLVLGTNCLSLCVVYKMMDRLTRPLQILTSLAFPDMLTPWAVITMYFPSSSCQEEIHMSLMLTAHNASSMTLLLLAVCHNIATFRPFTYGKLVSSKRLVISVIAIWILSVFTAHLHFLVTLMNHHSHTTYCQQVRNNTSIALIMSISVAFLTLIVPGTIYSRILRDLRLPMEACCGDHSKSARGVITGILLGLNHFFMWIPFLIVKLVQVHRYSSSGEGVFQAVHITMALILVGCMWDPLIYGMRMHNVKMGYLRLYHCCRGYVTTMWSRVARHGEAEELPEVHHLQASCDRLRANT